MNKGGQGLADLNSKIMASHMTAMKHLLHVYLCLAWRFLANSLLSRAGALGYSQDVCFFLIDAQHLDLTQRPSFYSSMLNAWKKVKVSCWKTSYTKEMFLRETLFYNPLFESIPKDRSFVEKFVGNNIRRVYDLLTGAGNWTSAATLAEAEALGQQDTHLSCAMWCFEKVP